MSDTKNRDKVSLIGCMQDVPDPRAPYNQKHKFLDIIIIAITAVLSGMDTWNEIEDWAHSVHNLHNLLSWCDAEIVLSSDWMKTKTLEDMKCFMKIHKLDQYLTDMVPENHQGSWKYEDISEYLSEHPKLSRYVVVDDTNMEKYFRGRFVATSQRNGCSHK